MKQKLLKNLGRYKLILIWLVIGALLSSILWKLQAVNNPVPDPNYLKDQRQESQTKKIQIKDSVKKQIESLQDVPVNAQPPSVGTPNPFNP